MGPVRKILRQVRPHRLIEIHVLSAPAQAQKVLAQAPGQWTALPIEADPTDAGGTLRYETQADDEQLAAALKMLVGAGISLAGFREVHADLEDAFMSLTS